MQGSTVGRGTELHDGLLPLAASKGDTRESKGEQRGRCIATGCNVWRYDEIRNI